LLSFQPKSLIPFIVGHTVQIGLTNQLVLNLRESFFIKKEVATVWGMENDVDGAVSTTVRFD